MIIRWIKIKNETEFQEIETMKKRIWNQLKKVAVLAALAGIVGNCVASASEFSAQEEQKVLLKQSAQWTDEKNFQAEVCLELSGLKELCTEMSENGNAILEQQNVQTGQNEQAVETEQPDEEDYINENAQAAEEMQLEKNTLSDDEDVYDEDAQDEDIFWRKIIRPEKTDRQKKINSRQRKGREQVTVRTLKTASRLRMSDTFLQHTCPSIFRWMKQD